MKRSLLVFLLLVLFLAGCTSNNFDNSPKDPPLVYLLKDGNLYDGFQSSYCWEQEPDLTLCVDMMEPYFDEVISLSSDAPLRFQFDTPLPDDVTISISDEIFGKEIISESVAPAELVNWSPSVVPGEYVVAVHVDWKQGDVTYWFGIVLE